MKKVSFTILSMFVVTAFLFLGCKKEPSADFTADNTTAWAYQNVTFTDLSTNTPTTWAWTFASGNPSTSTEQNPVVYWTKNGTFDAGITAKNSKGSGSTSKTGYVTVKSNLTLWSDFDNGYGSIYVYLSTTALNSSNYTSAPVTGTISSYWSSAPSCGTTNAFNANASGTVYYYAFDNNPARHWEGSITITQNVCNTLNFSNKKAQETVQTCAKCDERSNVVMNPKTKM